MPHLREIPGPPKFLGRGQGSNEFVLRKLGQMRGRKTEQVEGKKGGGLEWWVGVEVLGGSRGIWGGILLDFRGSPSWRCL